MSRVRRLSLPLLAVGVIVLGLWGWGAAGASERPSAQGASVQARPLVGRASLGYFPLIAREYVRQGLLTCAQGPRLLSPANGSRLDTLIPLFQVDRGSDPAVTEFRLEVARDPTFTQREGVFLWPSPPPGILAFRFGFNFSPATVYYWRASLRCGAVTGPSSVVWSFTTGSNGVLLPAPALIAPAPDSTVSATQVTLQWSTVAGAVEYLVAWQKVGETGPRYYRWASGSSVTIGGLSPATTYEWWVAARNDYAIGESSVRWRFTTSATAATVAAPPAGAVTVVDPAARTLEIHEPRAPQAHDGD